MPSTRAEKLWCTLVIENRSPETITIKSVQLQWGKFCNGGKYFINHLHFFESNPILFSLLTLLFIGYGPCNEIPPSDIEGKTIAPKKSYSIYACGRQASASGTEGSVDLYDKNDKISSVYWDCPWGPSSNVVQVRDVPSDWIISHSQFSPDGAIGTVNIKIAYIG